MPLSNTVKAKDAKGRDLAPIFGDLSQSEHCFEIEPPLAVQ